jgi:hypothetical protein
MRHVASTWVALLLTCIATPACQGPAVAPARPATWSTIVEQYRTITHTKVDVLFVIDDSPSMLEEQELLVDQVEAMAHEMIAPTDAAAPAIDDLRVGVVTANAIGGGVLRSEGRRPECQRTHGALECDREGGCPWLSHTILHPDDGTEAENPPLWEDLACIADVGTDGSAHEEPMAAAVAALTTQSEPGMPNEGFLREDSLLFIVFVTDEDDCSGISGVDESEPGIECLLREDELSSITDTHDALLELRGGDVNRISVAVIAGFPLDETWQPGDPVDQLRALRQVDDGEPLPTCETATARACAAPRLAELVYSFGNNGILESVCRADWTQVLLAILMCRGWCGDPLLCVPRWLPPESMSTCRIVHTLDDGVECLGLADEPGPGRSEGWSVDLGFDAEGNHRCEILSADADGDGCPDGARECPPGWDPSDGGLGGWFVDWSDRECEHGRLRFTDRLVTLLPGMVRIECQDMPCPSYRRCPEALAQTRGSACSYPDGTPPEVTEAPLVGPGGCCAEGFRCDGDRCIPDRTTSCTTSP